MEMKYRVRTLALILIWIILAMTVQTGYFGYARSLESSNQTVRGILLKVNENLADLIENESKIRAYYDNVNMDMGEIVSYLQQHGLEEDVPSEKHMKKM